MERNVTNDAKVPTFYELEFAGQLIVWATRKRLHLFASGTDDENAREAFRLGKLDELYAALMSIVDVLGCGAPNKIQLHAVACPCLAPHEIGLLDALAHLQAERSDLAYRRLAESVGSVAVRLVWPAMCSIVNELDERELRLWPIHAAPATQRQPTPVRAHATVH